jgi:hypothetical protein
MLAFCVVTPRGHVGTDQQRFEETYCRPSLQSRRWRQQVLPKVSVCQRLENPENQHGRRLYYEFCVELFAFFLSFIVSLNFPPFFFTFFGSLSPYSLFFSPFQNVLNEPTIHACEVVLR